ncbi:MAG TPA: DMT family transporter [Gammaproteobacteria bacterium]
MPPSHAHRPVLGILLKLLSVLFLASMAACVKYLGADVPAGQTIFVRGVISVAVLALIAWRTAGLHLLKTANWRSHALRSLSGTISMFCWFYALTLLPLADLTAIVFTAPMFLTLLAMLFLGERIHRYRWSALGIGFAGVLIMTGPHLTFGGGSPLGVVVGLGAAVFAALAMVFLRSMSGQGGEHPITITFYFSLTSMICAALTALAGWPMPTAEQAVVIVAAGVLGVFGQLLMTSSYRYAEASTIAPLDYTNLLAALAFGYFFFGETPQLSTWIGAPLVIAAGSIILWREYVRSRARAATTPVAPNV